MIWLDLVVVGVVVLGTLNGLRRGFIRSLLGLLGLIAALTLGWTYSSEMVGLFEATWGWRTRLAEYLATNVPYSHSVGGVLTSSVSYGEMAEILLSVMAFALIFLIVRIAAIFVANILHMALGWGFTGFINRMLGGLFGFFTWVLGLSIILGVLVTASTSVEFLSGLAEAVEASHMSQELVRIFYLMSPLRQYLIDYLI